MTSRRLHRGCGVLTDRGRAGDGGMAAIVESTMAMATTTHRLLPPTPISPRDLRGLPVRGYSDHPA